MSTASLPAATLSSPPAAVTVRKMSLSQWLLGVGIGLGVMGGYVGASHPELGFYLMGGSTTVNAVAAFYKQSGD